MIASSGFDPRPVAYLRKIYEAAIRAADVILNPATVENELEIEPPTNSHGDASQPHPNSLIGNPRTLCMLLAHQIHPILFKEASHLRRPAFMSMLLLTKHTNRMRVQLALGTVIV